MGPSLAGGSLGEMGLGWLLTLSAAIACAAWGERSRRPAPLPRRSAIALALWSGLFAVVHLLGVARARGSLAAAGVGGLTLVLALGGMLAAGLGVAWAMQAAVLAGRLPAVVVDSVVLGIGVVTVMWALTGADRVGPDAVVPLTLALFAAILLAGLLRARGVSPSLVVDGRFTPVLGWVALASAFFCLAGWAGLNDGPVASWLGAASATAGHLVTAVIALTLSPAPLPAPAARRFGLLDRLGPTIVAIVAAFALLLRAMPAVAGGQLGPSGRIGALLALGLFVSLMISRVLAVRENDQLTADLEYSRARLAAMAANSGDVIIGLDEDARVLAVNDAAISLLGRAPQDLIGTDIAALAADEDRMRVRSQVLDVVHARQDDARVELTLAPPAVGTAELRLRGVPGGAVANLSDVTESVQLRERLMQMTRFDQMTGLANRTHLLDEIGRWLDGGEPVGVLYIDLDGFKAVNDRFGHVAGDEVLVEVARRLSRVAAADAGQTLVARTGGDEFVVALCGRTMAQAADLGAVVLAAMRPTFQVARRQVRLGASIGVSATDDGSSAGPGEGAGGAAGLLHRADIAMYAAKEAGRFQVRGWDAELERRVRRRVDIAIVLRRALATGRLALAYQPIVRLTDGVIVSAEALIRLQAEAPADGSPTGYSELVSPSELVEVAEGTGEIDELGRWVLTEATHQASLWARMNRNVRVTVNMSVRQLSDPTFEDAVVEALAAAGLPADRLVVEITEGQLLGEGDVAHETITRLRERGVRLAIDDFGSGYSSLSYLRRMPVSAVKIDRTLLAGVGSDDRATTVVRAVIGVARALGLRVICEGIESLAMARFLRDLGAYAGQGFALYEALSPEALRDALEEESVDLSGTTRNPATGVSHSETGRPGD